MLELIETLNSHINVVVVGFMSIASAWFANFWARKKNKAEVTAQDLVNTKTAHEINQMALDNAKAILANSLEDMRQRMGEFHEREMALVQQVREANDRLTKLEVNNSKLEEKYKAVQAMVCNKANCPDRVSNL